jgi:hypothetical protein
MTQSQRFRQKPVVAATESVSFYLACGVRARDLMPHRPEVCYPGNGWTLTEQRFMDVPLGDGRTLPYNVVRFSRGVFNTQSVVVLDYCVVDGQYCRGDCPLGGRMAGASVRLVDPVVCVPYGPSARTHSQLDQRTAAGNGDDGIGIPPGGVRNAGRSTGPGSRTGQARCTRADKGIIAGR